MYPVSRYWREAMARHSIEYRWSGRLITKEGVTYEFDASRIEEGSGKLTRQLCPGKDLVLGATCAAQLEIGLRYSNISRYSLLGGTIIASHELMIGGGTWESCPLGVFEIIDPPERSRNGLKIVAYDYMQRFNADFGETLAGAPWDIYLHACEVCEVEPGNTREDFYGFPNGQTETWALADIKVETWRDLIGHLAAYLCCNAIIGPDAKLYFLPYRMESDIEIPPSGRFEYTPKDYLTRYTSVTHYFRTAQEYENISVGEGGLDLDLGQNPFLQFNDDIKRREALENIARRLSEMAYMPYSGSFPSDPSLLPGDVVTFSGNHAGGADIPATITKQVIKLHGGMTLECGGDDPNLNVLSEREKQLRAIAQTSAVDGMFYYDFHNAAEIRIGDHQMARVMEFHYTTTKRTHVDFHAEFKMRVETTEDYDEERDEFTERDGVIEVGYRMGGEPVKTYYPVDLFTDGTQLLHLVYTWWASSNIISSFSVYIQCLGCSIVIPAGAGRGYIAGPGLVGETDWDGSVYVYDNFPVVRPYRKFRKDFSEEILAYLAEPELPDFAESFTRRNLLRSFAKRLSDDVGAAITMRISTAYDAENVELENTRLSQGVWINSVSGVDGTVTTPELPVPRILRVTSQNVAGSGSVTYIASFDGGETWYSYAGGWSEYVSGHGMAQGVLRAIPAEDWKEMLVERGSVMLRAILEGDASLSDFCVYTVAGGDFDSIDHRTAIGTEHYLMRSRDRTELRTVYHLEGTDISCDFGRMNRCTVHTENYSEIDEIRIDD